MQSATKAPVEFTLHAHDRAITDINFSAHHPEILATCGVDSFVHTWDLRAAQKTAGVLQTDLKKPLSTLAQFEAGSTQVKWNRTDEHLLASSHNKRLYIWDLRRGAKPLTTVDAHTTQIYGIDWHRSDRSKILTCSLDKTIKLWDGIGTQGDIKTPSRTISTDYPIWRARHTPFPNGILAMPKRGSSALNLYTLAADDQEVDSTKTKPAHSFKAHAADAQVEEFLWRTRGDIDNGTDEREFQLISWGTDRHLHLHSIKPDLLYNAVGFKKGAPAFPGPSITRRGAKYVSYRDPAPTTPELKPVGKTEPVQLGNLSSLLQQHQTIARSNINSRATMSVGPVRHNDVRVVSQITWIDGVRIGERNVSSVITRKPNSKHETQHEGYDASDLADEIRECSREFGKDVLWETMKLDERQISLWLRGPWGTSMNGSVLGSPAAIWIRIHFPKGYPNAYSPMLIVADKTVELDDDTTKQLNDNFHDLANEYALHGRKALKAVLSYALGRRDLEESLIVEDELRGGEEEARGGEERLATSPTRDESSSEDDFEGNEKEANDLMNSSQSNANVPTPIHCIARFSVMGFLVTSRKAPSKYRSLLAPPFRLSRHPRELKRTAFESLGRLPPADMSSNGSDKSDSSWESSSNSSSNSSENESGAPMSRFQPPAAWQKGTSRYQHKSAYPTATNASKTDKKKSVISILGASIEEIISSKKHLAVRYRIFGDGPTVCAHNAGIARSFGYTDLADIWELCKLILNNQVPLEILPQQHRREQVLVLARRALVRIKRKDSGLDLQFDEAESVTNPRLKGRIKWGNHSVVTWLIPAIFDHFERLADTQMLAMLSCIFAEPAAREGITSAMAKMRQSNLPMSMEAPAFSLDYFPSAEVAWSLFKPTISNTSTPPHSRYATPVNEVGWHRLSKALDVYGSHGSSNGPWGMDAPPSEPVTPYSTDNTPPLVRTYTIPTYATSTSHTPYSTSPEQPQTAGKRASANLASAFMRPFSNVLSTSPSARVGTRTDDFSTSAPANSVTWGTTTFYSSGSNEQRAPPRTSKHGKRASFGQSDQVNVDYHSDSDDEFPDMNFDLDGITEYPMPSTPGEDDDREPGAIKVTLKNQDQFDDEACASKPLLDGKKEWLYRAWREQYAEMLGCWGLVSQRAEILKFNGLISYFPPVGSRAGSKTGSMSLALKKENNASGRSSQSISRTSTLALPYTSRDFRRSPTSSPRHFSFNPEASEFRPGSLFSPEFPAEKPRFAALNESFLRLSLPAITKNFDGDEDVGGETAFDDVTESRISLAPRPRISRHASNVSGASVSSKRYKKEPIYSCSICWIRVNGRFYLCPACGHVAHFACMDEGVGLEEGQCVVGCGCGCGFEEDNDGARLIDEFREWEEKWAPVAEDTIYSALSRDGSEMGDVGKWTEDVAKESREKKGEKTRVNANAKENERERMKWKGKAKGKGKGKIAEMVLDAERDMY
jgi:hypothetical protein